jgi:hypothetical protein
MPFILAGSLVVVDDEMDEGSEEDNAMNAECSSSDLNATTRIY